MVPVAVDVPELVLELVRDSAGLFESFADLEGVVDSDGVLVGVVLRDSDDETDERTESVLFGEGVLVFTFERDPESETLVVRDTAGDDDPDPDLRPEAEIEFATEMVHFGLADNWLLGETEPLAEIDVDREPLGVTVGLVEAEPFTEAVPLIDAVIDDRIVLVPLTELDWQVEVDGEAKGDRDCFGVNDEVVESELVLDFTGVMEALKDSEELAELDGEADILELAEEVRLIRGVRDVDMVRLWRGDVEESGDADREITGVRDELTDREMRPESVEEVDIVELGDGDLVFSDEIVGFPDKDELAEDDGDTETDPETVGDRVMARTVPETDSETIGDRVTARTVPEELTEMDASADAEGEADIDLFADGERDTTLVTDGEPVTVEFLETIGEPEGVGEVDFDVFIETEPIIEKLKSALRE